MKIASFNIDVEYNDRRPLTKVILETSFSKEIRILFKKGQVMKEHKTPFPIIVHILEGELDFGILGISNRLKAGFIITLEGKVLHDLTAREDSIVRLTLLKMDNPERVEKIAKN
ncbi:cupin domain-containing protein [Flaviramulus aquimarinus]|uniref:Cupin domain-containing protein n=1 Tax=Flaviramulus aquimarinus TaxID=1170456 RepID=A0ABP9ETP5_9FLAO